jgi:hypothetical protein
LSKGIAQAAKEDYKYCAGSDPRQGKAPVCAGRMHQQLQTSLENTKANFRARM